MEPEVSYQRDDRFVTVLGKCRLRGMEGRRRSETPDGRDRPPYASRPSVFSASRTLFPSHCSLHLHLHLKLSKSIALDLFAFDARQANLNAMFRNDEANARNSIHDLVDISLELRSLFHLKHALQWVLQQNQSKSSATKKVPNKNFLKSVLTLCTPALE